MIHIALYGTEVCNYNVRNENPESSVQKYGGTVINRTRVRDY